MDINNVKQCKATQHDLLYTTCLQNNFREDTLFWNYGGQTPFFQKLFSHLVY